MLRFQGFCIRARRGFVLAVAMALAFVCVTIALVVANQYRAMVGFARNTRADALETEGAYYASTVLRSLLPPVNGSPDSRLGLPDPLPPAPAGASAQFVGNATDLQTHFFGNLTYFTNGTQATMDGYTGHIPAAGASSIKVPYLHSCAVLTANVTSERVFNKYFCLYSSSYPYALVAAGGTLSADSVRSVSTYNGANISALMANVYGQGVTIRGHLNGRAYSNSSVTLAGPGGIPHPNWGNAVSVPGDFAQQLSDFKARASTGDLNLMTALAGLNQGASTISFDTPTGTLNAGPGLRIPPGGHERLDFRQININGDLWLEENTVLYLTGNLFVTGSIRLSPHSSLVVDGTTSASALSVVSGASTQLGILRIGSTLYSGGALTLNNAMNRDPSVTFAGVNAYVGHILPTGTSDTVQVPGVLLACGDTLTIRAGSRVSGLLWARNISVDASMLVGAAWASGSLAVRDVRYYPYYTHFFAYTAQTPSMPIWAVQQHAIGFGRLP